MGGLEWENLYWIYRCLFIIVDSLLGIWSNRRFRRRVVCRIGGSGDLVVDFFGSSSLGFCIKDLAVVVAVVVPNEKLHTFQSSD